MKISCTVNATKTYTLTLTKAEGALMSQMMRLIDMNNLALRVVCQLTSVIGAADLSVEDMVEPMTEEMTKFGQMTNMVRELSRLDRM